jgi:uncharacterized protein
MDIYTFLILVFFGIIIYIANQEDAGATVIPTTRSLLSWLLFVVAGLTFIYGLLILQSALFSDVLAAEADLPVIDTGAAALSFSLSTVAAVFSVLVISRLETRRAVQRVLGPQAVYNPDSRVHTTAIVLSLAVASAIIGSFVLGGGIDGLAETLETEGLSFTSMVFQLIVFVLVSFLGVGLFIRRELKPALARLGLRVPLPQDVTNGIFVGVGLYGMTLVFNALWLLTATPEQIAAQTAASDQLAQALNTLPLLMLVSISAPLGEEILFRGALQPVFGVWATSLLFTVMHTQYALTPATLGIFIVSLGMSWLRRRHSTSAAIVGHFAYNFVQLVPLIVMVAAGSGG